MKKLLTALLILLAVALQVVYGYLEVTGKDKVWIISKEHARADAVFLLLLAVAVSVAKLS